MNTVIPFKHQFKAKRQTNAGTHQGKWCVYRPDGIRLVVVEDGRGVAESLAWALNWAAHFYEIEGKGDWHKLLGKAPWK